MVVIAIVGVLASVAIPQYQHYTQRARWANNLSYLSGVQTAFAVCFAAEASVAACDTPSELGLSNNGVATDLALPSGVARFNAASNGANRLTIVLTGDAAAGQCVVNASVDVSASPMQWVFQTAASTPECDRDQTGVGASTG